MKVINFAWKLLSNDWISSFIVFHMWLTILINYNLGLICWEHVRESSLLKMVYTKKKIYDKKMLRLSKGMLRIITP